MGHNFLNKALDMSKVTLNANFPSVGNHDFTNIIELSYSGTEDTHTMSDPDIYNNVITIRNGVTKTEVKIKTFIGSDDDIYLARAINASGLGTLTYIDNRTDNKVSASGEGVSVQKVAERTANVKDTEIEYILQCPKFTIRV
ncbi:MAG: hypothetical protein KBF12_02895 [Sebaldella sp.]|nr:hypothetical protein [Sebaldella sp.]